MPPFGFQNNTSAGGSSSGGSIAGESTTYALLPLTRLDGSDLIAGDTSFLLEDDGANLSGTYVWSGTSWVFRNPDFDMTFDTNEAILTAFTPTFYNGTTFVAAQGTTALSAQYLVVATGKALEKGVHEAPSHGFIIGEEYVTDPDNLGGIITRGLLTAGQPYQKLFTVPNANEIVVDVQPLIDTIPQEVELDYISVNEFIHNIGDYGLVIAHEGAGGTGMNISLNGNPVTYNNLTNATDNGGGDIGFLGGTNQNFNRRASTVETLKKVGEYFEIIKPATAQFDSQFISFSTSNTVLADTANDTYRLQFIGTGFNLRDKTDTIVATGTQEIGTYRITRTAYGIEVIRNDVVIYTSPEVCIDYNTTSSTTISAQVNQISNFGSIEVPTGANIGEYLESAPETALLFNTDGTETVGDLRDALGAIGGAVVYWGLGATASSNRLLAELIPAGSYSVTRGGDAFVTLVQKSLLIEDACGELIRTTATAQNIAGQPAGNGLMKIDFAENLDNEAGVSYDNVTGIVSGQSQFEITLTASFITAGTSNTSARSYHFHNLLNGDAVGVVSGTSGVFGQGATQTPASVVIPKDTAFSYDIRSVSSANNQRVQQDSFLKIDVCGDLQDITTDYLENRNEKGSEVVENIIKGSTGLHRIGKHTPAAPVNIATSTIETGFDFTQASEMSLKLFIEDNVSDRGWDVVELDVDSLMEAYNNDPATTHGFMNIHDNDFVSIRIVNPATGEIILSDSGREVKYVKSELWIVAIGVSRRVGMTEWGVSGRLPSEGYLAMTGVVTNGAIDYPVAASMRPFDVVGDDFDFTKYEGATIRNLGGNAEAEGVFQSFATNVDGITVTDPTPTGRQTNRRTGGSNAAFPNTTNVSRSLQGGAIETRMDNVAEQKYLIVDTYHELTGNSNSSALDNNTSGSYIVSTSINSIGISSVSLPNHASVEEFLLESFDNSIEVYLDGSESYDTIGLSFGSTSGVISFTDYDGNVESILSSGFPQEGRYAIRRQGSSAIFIKLSRDVSDKVDYLPQTDNSQQNNPQGAYIGWSTNQGNLLGNGTGRTQIINHRGLGIGGIQFAQTVDNSNYEDLALLDSTALSLRGKQVKEVLDPTLDQDAANKSYVDNSNTSAEVELVSSYIPNANSTWENTPLSISLPSAGTYFIPFATEWETVNVSGNSNIFSRLVGSIQGVIFPSEHRFVGGSNVNISGLTSYHAIVTTSGPETLTLQCNVATGVDFASILGATKIGYIKLA